MHVCTSPPKQPLAEIYRARDSLDTTWICWVNMLHKKASSISYWLSGIAKHLIREFSRICFPCSGEMLTLRGADECLLSSSWHDRIPLTLLFGISTSVELFEARLPRSSIALLKGRFFELHEASNCVDHIYERIQAECGKLWLGRTLTSVLFEKSSDHFQTPESFCRTVKVSSRYLLIYYPKLMSSKYAYMSHFFANSLSVLLADEIPATIQQDKLCEAIRNVPSFRT